MRSYAFIALALSGAPLLAESAFAQVTTAPVAAPAPVAPAGAYVIDKTHASVVWKIKHQGLSFYTARFTGMDAQLDFDPTDVAKSMLTATIDPKSVETDFAKTRHATDTRDFNAEIASPQILNAAKFPTITFTSTKVVKTAADKGRVTGNLTLLGVTKPVTLDVTYVGDRPDPRTKKHKVGFSASGAVKRSDFGMTFGGGFLGDEIQLLIEAEFYQK